MMKNLIVSLLLIEMILLPFPNVGFNSTGFAEDSDTTCTEGQVFDTSLNRCVLSTQTVEDKTNARNCEGLDGDEFKDCFNQNVDKEMAEAKSDGEVEGATDPKKSYGIPAVVTLASATILLTKKDSLEGCSSTSTWLMLGGGVSTLLGEFMAQKKYKDKINGMSDDYKKRMSEKSEDEEEAVEIINENQTIAFDFQIEQEKARKDAHSARKSVYMLGMGLYTASTVAALYEAFTSSGSDGCNASYNHDTHSTDLLLVADAKTFSPFYYLNSLTSDEIIEVIKRKLSNFPFKNSHAEGITAFISTIGDKLGPATKTAGNAIGKAVKSPYVRAAVSGILALHSKKVADDAGDLADEADKRIALLEDLKASFEANGGAGFGVCSDADRKLTSKPACYCFLNNGDRDPGKTKSAICDGVYGEASKLAKTDYNANNNISEQGVKGCFTKTKQFDADCTCKSKTDTGGNDACLRINGQLKLGSLGSISGLKDMMKDTVAFTQGNISTGELNTSGNENLALRLSKIKDKLEATPKYKKEMAKVNNLQKKLNKQINGIVSKGLSSGSISNPFGGGLNAAIKPVSAKDALKNMKSSIKRNNAKFKSGGNLAGSKKRTGMDDYDFGAGAKGSTGVDIEDMDDVMKKEYSFNDINENPDNSIFKIISNRYHRSGLRRLFDEKGVSKADDSDGTDINEK
ncbi:MAG: hypothetical protein ACJAS4_003382 [Bacteriovoracaceae bacterium]|jgi:hypothetical protein